MLSMMAIAITGLLSCFALLIGFYVLNSEGPGAKMISFFAGSAVLLCFSLFLSYKTLRRIIRNNQETQFGPKKGYAGWVIAMLIIFALCVFAFLVGPWLIIAWTASIQ